MNPLALIPVISNVIDKIWPDAESAAQAKLRLLELEQSGQLTELAKRGDIVKAEAESEHWLTATWRPITMLVFVFIIANNYILAPYIDLFFVRDISLELPPQMWSLLQIGIGGYIASRGAERVTRNLRMKND